jgi:hypothetical protein
MAWNTSFRNAPADGNSPAGVDDAIRTTKSEVQAVINNEHELDHTDTTKKGQHKEGSGRAYYPGNATLPTTRPDNTALGDEDVGRICVLEHPTFTGLRQTYVYTGATDGWVLAEPGPLTGAICAFLGPPPLGAKGETQWLKCDGTEILVGAYPALYAYLTTNRATQSATLPNLAGRYLRASDGSHGIDTAEADQIAQHDHQVQGTIDSSATGVTVDSGGDHSHTVTGHDTVQGNGALTAATGSNKPEVTSETSTDGAHTHTVTDPEHSHDLIGGYASTTEHSTSEFGTETRPVTYVIDWYIHV